MTDDQKEVFVDSIGLIVPSGAMQSSKYFDSRTTPLILQDSSTVQLLTHFPDNIMEARQYFDDTPWRPASEVWEEFKPLWQNPWAINDTLTATAKPSAISKKVFGPPAPKSGNADTTPTTSTGSISTSVRRKPKLGGAGNIHRLLSRNPAGAFHRLKQMGILGSPQDSDTSSAPLPPSNTTNKPTP